MRRGRPPSSHTPEPKSRQSSPLKEKTPTQTKIQSWLDEGLAADEDKVIKVIKTSQTPAVRGHRSGAATVDAWKVRNPAPPVMDDAWNLEGRDKDAGKDKPKTSPGTGFENDFADKLWNSFDGPSKDVVGPASKPLPIPGRSAMLPMIHQAATSLLFPGRARMHLMV
jgi:AP2-associated kinase